MNTVSATPAYGRDYGSRAAVLADWAAGKDFTMNHHALGSGYFSIRDSASLLEQGIEAVAFRYAKQRKQFIHRLALPTNEEQVHG